MAQAYTVQDLFIWSDKLRQANEQVARNGADVKMLTEAVSALPSATVGGHHSTSQLEFAQAELARVQSQYDISLGMVKEIVAALDKAK
jgi:VIT1/CCC1 family predicted Fe2+/Mn2+ transporter